MPNLDLEIAKIMKGDTEVLKVMQGNTEVWPDLPYDSEVQYLQSDGTAYIDTGIKVSTQNVTIKARLKFSELSTSDNNILFGCYDTVSGGRRLFAFVNSNGKWAIAYSSASASTTTALTSNASAAKTRLPTANTLSEASV